MYAAPAANGNLARIIEQRHAEHDAREEAARLQHAVAERRQAEDHEVESGRIGDDDKYGHRLAALHPLLARQGEKAWWLVPIEPATGRTGRWHPATVGPRGAEVFVFKVDSGKTPSLRLVCILPSATTVLVLEGGNKPPWWGSATISDDGTGLNDLGIDGLRDADDIDAPDAMTAAWIQIADPMAGWIRSSSLERGGEDRSPAHARPADGASLAGGRLMGRAAARTALLRAMAHVRSKVIGRNPMDTCVRAAARLLKDLVGTFVPAEGARFSAEEAAELAALGAAFGRALGGYSWPPRQVDGAFRKDGSDCPWWPIDYEGHFGHTFLVLRPLDSAAEGSTSEDEEEIQSLSPWFCRSCSSRVVDSTEVVQVQPFHAWRVIHKDKVAVREEPQLHAPIIDTLPPGELVHELNCDLPVPAAEEEPARVGLGGDDANTWIAVVGGGWVLTDASGPPLGLGRLLRREPGEDADTFAAALAHAMRAGRRGAHTTSMRGRCAECGHRVFAAGQRPQLPRGWGGLPRGALICDMSADQFDRALPRLMLVAPLEGGVVPPVRRRYESRLARAHFDGQIRMRHSKLFAEHEGGGNHATRQWGDTLREIAVRSDRRTGEPRTPGTALSNFKPHRAHGRHRYKSKPE